MEKEIINLFREKVGKVCHVCFTPEEWRAGEPQSFKLKEVLGDTGWMLSEKMHRVDMNRALVFWFTAY